LPEVAWCLQERDAKGADSDTKPGHLIPVIGGGFDVAHSLRADGFDASEDGTGRGTPLVPVAIQNATRGKDQNGLGIAEPGDPMFTLDQGSQHAIAFAQNQRDEVRAVAGALAAEPGMKQQTYIAFSCKDHGADAGDSAPTLRAIGHSGSHANAGGQVAVAIAIQGAATRENPASGPDGVGVRADDTAYTLEARSEVQAVAFESRFARNGRGAPSDVVPPLKAQSGETGKGDAAPLVAFHNRQDPDVSGDVTHPLGAKDNGLGLGLGPQMQVRRLTPRECERLQGFPDDYTLIPVKGKPAKDGPRYRALGNSMAVPVMRWIGKRIEEAVATAGASCTPR